MPHLEYTLRLFIHIFPKRKNRNSNNNQNHQKVCSEDKLRDRSLVNQNRIGNCSILKKQRDKKKKNLDFLITVTEKLVQLAVIEE